ECTRPRRGGARAEPPTVARYLNASAKAVKPDGEPVYAAATVARWAAAIADRHRATDHPPPTDTRSGRSALAAIKRSRSAPVAAPRSAAPLLTDDIATMVAVARKGTL